MCGFEIRDLRETDDLVRSGSSHAEAFFALHDLNRDGVLDESELEAIYGLHHETSRTESGSHDEHQDKSKDIMTAVLKSLDKNKDGVVTVREFVAAGAGGLPNFKDVKGLGHHYGELSMP